MHKINPTVLLYHRIAVTTPSEDPLRLAVSPERFRNQMKYLRDRGYRTKIPEEISDPENRNSAKTIIITFDDGYLDTYTNAFPILQDVGFSAIVFLVSALVGKHSIWDPCSKARLMDWSQAREMSEYRIRLQSHTCTHPDLTTISDRSVIQELRESKGKIEDKIGKAVCYLAYPYGMYDSRIVDMTKKAGYHGAFAAGASDRKPYSMERFEITMHDNAFLFILKTNMSGYLIRRLYSSLRSKYSKMRRVT